MRVSIDLEVWWDGQDEMSVAHQIKAIKEMIKSGAESFNFDVQINKMEQDMYTLPKPKWEHRCGSCRFMDTTAKRCTQRNIFVKMESPSCPQWRYFA